MKSDLDFLRAHFLGEDLKRQGSEFNSTSLGAQDPTTCRIKPVTHQMRGPVWSIRMTFVLIRTKAESLIHFIIMFIA